MIGVLLDKYRIVSKLGEGGMGVVYMARHEALGQSVVVKVLKPEMSRNAEMVQRFFNEAQSATAIRHLGIVQVFDVGTAPDGCAYFVMELLEGQSLGARLKQQRRLDYTDVCRIGRQIAKVLQAAHAAGIMHRDLKPENLFLVPDDEAMGGERIKVLDFGIAKLAGNFYGSGVRTRTGMIMGTPHYMSPEQCRGAGSVDSRSDIYSLGCILFRMACGRPPFVGEGDGEILGAHQYLDAPHPQGLAPDIPPGLAALIESMLAKQPDARPQTMASVSMALDEILQSLGVPTRATTIWSAPAPASSSPVALAPTIPPVAEPSPTSSTLADSAGATTIEPATHRRRWPFVLGGVLGAGALAAILAIFATRGSTHAEPQIIRAEATTVPSPPDAAAAGDAAVQIAAASADAPDPSGAPADDPDSPPTAPDAPSAVPTAQRGAVELECLGYQKSESWAALAGCADRLRPLNAALAGELRSRAVQEAQAAPQIAAVEAALREKNLLRARSELDRTWTGSAAYPRLKAKYEAAEDAAIADAAAALDRVNSGDCQDYLRLLVQLSQAQPPRVAAEAQRRVTCVAAAATSPAKCNATALAERAKDQVAAGMPAAALTTYQAAYECKPELHYLRKAFVIACELRDVPKAKSLWRTLSPEMKQSSVSECIRNGITEDRLNAP